MRLLKTGALPNGLPSGWAQLTQLAGLRVARTAELCFTSLLSYSEGTIADMP